MAPTKAHRGAAALRIGVLLGLLPLVLAGLQRPAPPLRISSLKAMLFYSQTGAFSADLFGPSAPTLHNVRTGVGQAMATLVVIEITGPPDTYAPTRKISFAATAGRRALLTKTLDVGLLGEAGKFHVAFWLDDTGCTPVVLKARIVGQSDDTAVEKTINFKCGD